MSTSLPYASSLRDQRCRLFFWLGVFVLPVFWSWFTLGRRFSTNQRKLAFGWMASYLLFLACAHEWFVSRGELLAADRQGVLTAYGYWMSMGVGCWLVRCTLIEVLFLFFVFGPYLGHVLGHRGVEPFLGMAACLIVARWGLAWWEDSLARAQMAHRQTTPT